MVDECISVNRGHENIRCIVGNTPPAVAVITQNRELTLEVFKLHFKRNPSDAQIMIIYYY